MMIKDSGKRIQMAGMVRDTAEDKTRYDLVFDGPMFERWAKHLTAGAKKYSARNWVGAKSQEELDRFRESAIRHFIQWFMGETDEDHAAAVFFNINGVEHVKQMLSSAEFVTTASMQSFMRGRSPSSSITFTMDTRSGAKDRRVCMRDIGEYRRTASNGRRLSDVTVYSAIVECGE